MEGFISRFEFSTDAVKPAHSVQVKNGEHRPQSPSPLSWSAVCSTLSSGQLSNEQQGIAKRNNK